MPIWGWILIGTVVITILSYVGNYYYRTNNEFYDYCKYN